MYFNAPQYLLRKYCILTLIKDLPKRKTLEIGCGAGDLCETLCKRGFIVRGIDVSAPAIKLCQNRLAHYPQGVPLTFEQADFFELTETFDIVLFFEVLEHLQDDVAALKKIYDLVAPHGHLLMSVPAHQKMFGPSDQYVGHFRRYEKKELEAKLKAAGFAIVHFWSYGVPLTLLTNKIRNILSKPDISLSKKERTAKSGIERNHLAFIRFVSNDFFLFPFYWLQMLFLKTDIGAGYIIKAKKI